MLIQKALTRTARGIPQQAARSLFDLAKVRPTGKSYGYPTPSTLSPNGAVLLDELYRKFQTHHDLMLKKGIKPKDIQEKMMPPDAMPIIEAITDDLNTKNPDYHFRFFNMSPSFKGVSNLHADTRIKEREDFDGALIVPVQKHSKQAMFFENIYGTFERINSNIPNTQHYRVKFNKHEAFKNELQEEVATIPHDAFASVFSVLDQNGNPLVHCAPFDTYDVNKVHTLAMTGYLGRDNHRDNIPTRCLAIWGIKKAR